MSKKTKPVKEKKPGNPVLKGFGIPILYAALTTAFSVVAAITIMLQQFLHLIIGEIGFAMLRDTDPALLFPDIFDQLLNHAAEYLCIGAVNVWHHANSIILISLALALVVIILVLAKKGKEISETLLSKHSPKKSVFSAITLGLGVGGIVLFLQVALIVIGITVAKGIIAPDSSLRQLLHDWSVDLRFQQSSNNFMWTQTLGYILENLAFGRMTNEPSLAQFVLGMALRALVLPCIFCLGAAGNFKKKMPLFVAALLTGMLFVLFGGNTVGLFSTLLLGLFLGLIYAKTDSLISAVVFMLCSGIPTLGLYLLRAPFGIETTLTYNGYHGYEFTCFGFYYLANNVSLFAQFALVYLLLTLLASIVLLLVGIILLISIGKGKKKAETEEQKEEPEAPDVLNSDPFADI